MQFKHIEQVRAKTIFSECLKFRYRLDVTLQSIVDGQSLIVCAIMQNPSVANSDWADKSAQFLEKLVFTKGLPEFAGATKLIIVNQFAFVQTTEFSGSDEHIGLENDKHIQEAISESDVILVAWGSSNIYESRKNVINIMLKNNNNKILLQGRSHPSRASYDGYVSAYKI